MHLRKYTPQFFSKSPIRENRSYFFAFSTLKIMSDMTC